MNVLVPHHHHHLSFSQCAFLSNPMKTLRSPPARASTVIRMGGGPRTYPGGVSKWQWKRMQERKAKQLLKARLSRERQIYEMRKRAELKAAVSELERPWEVVKREEAPNLFSVGADEQVKVLADRFQRPGGFDMWSERDGPMLFESPDELPSARFFPKGVVHSVKPYRRVDGYGLVKGGLLEGNDFGGGLSEKGIGLEVVEGSEVGGDGGEYLSSDVSYGMEGHGGLREKWDGSGVLLEDFDGSESEGDDGECSSSDVSHGRNGVEGDGGLEMNVNGNGMRFLSDDVGRSSHGGRSSRLNYGRNGVGDDGRLRRNGNGNGNVRRFSSSSDGERPSHSNYGRNGMGGDGGLRRNRNGRRVLSDNVDRSRDGEQSSRYGRNGVDGDGGLRRNGNGRRVLSDDVGRSSDRGHSSHLNYQRNGLNVEGRMRRNGNGSKYASRGIDDGEHSPRSSTSGRYTSSFDGRLRNKGDGRGVISKDVYGSSDDGLRSKKNGRRIMSKDVDGSSGFYSRGVGSVRKQRGGNSIGGRSQGKYTNRNSDYASPRGRGAKSEVYDMGLQKDGSYEFQQKHEQ